MHIVINISEEDFQRCKKRLQMRIDTMGNAIANGVPLPKGHGKLKDADKISDRLEALRDDWNYYGNEFESGMYKGYDYALDEVMDAPTIIEADEVEE